MSNISENVEAALASIGRQMVKSNNQATSYPVWMVGTRFFLCETDSLSYCEERGGKERPRVVSAYDNGEVKLLMKACLEAAGVQEHRQANNAYHGLFR